jgi:hypothetical protein
MIISLLVELNNEFSINEIISVIIVYSILFFVIRKYFPQYLKYLFYIWIIDLFYGYNLYKTNKKYKNYKKEIILDEKIVKNNEESIINNETKKEESNIENESIKEEETNIKMVVKKEFPSRENTKDNPQEFVTQEENKLIEN